MAQLIQILPGADSPGHIKTRQLIVSEFDGHAASLCDSVCILQSLRRIGEQGGHLLRRFDIILSAFISHTVLILQLLPGLEAEKNIVGRRVLRTGIMAVIRRDKADPQFSAHAQQLGVHLLLLRNPVVLQFQEEIPLPEDIPVGQSRLLCLLIEAAGQKSLYFSRKAGACADDPLMISAQYFFIHSGFVIISVHEALGHDLHQVRVTLVVLGKQDQMKIAVISPADLTVETGSRRDVDFTSDNRPDFLRQALLIEIDHAVHHAVIRDRRGIHAELFHTGDIFLYLIGTVQKTVLRMDMQMCEIQTVSFPNCSAPVIPFHAEREPCFGI